MWENCDVQPFLLLPTVLDLCLQFRKLFMVWPILLFLSLLDAGDSPSRADYTSIYIYICILGSVLQPGIPDVLKVQQLVGSTFCSATRSANSASSAFVFCSTSYSAVCGPVCG